MVECIFTILTKEVICLRKKGFTLLELVIVIIILGVLATLGMAQYMRMVERSRGGKAKDVLGSLRKQALAYYMQTYGSAGLLSTDAGLGTANDLTPSACRQSHFFSLYHRYPCSRYHNFDGYALHCHRQSA